MRTYRSIVLSVFLSSCALALPMAAHGSDGRFMQVADGKLVLNGQPAALPSVNMFDLVHLYTTDPPRGRAKLQRARQAGFRAIRFFAAGTYNEATTLFPAVELWENPLTAQDFFAAFDQMEHDANEFGLKLIPSLITGYSDPTERTRPTGAACRDSPFSLPMLPGSANRATMTRFAKEVVSRYRDSTTVLFWEVSNEANLNAMHRNPAYLCVTHEQIAGYLTEVARSIKELDPNHLVAGGAIQEDSSVPLADIPGPFNDAADWFVFYTALPGIDISTVHVYDPYPYRDGSGAPQSAAAFLTYFNDVAIAMDRPLWIGEFGVPGGASWSDNNFNDAPMSVLLAQKYLQIGLASAWNWESKEYGRPDYHWEMVQYSIDPGEDDDATIVLTQGPFAMGEKSALFTWTSLVGDVNGDGRDDLVAASNRGTWQVSIGGTSPGIPGQWLSAFSDEVRDPGGAPFQRLTGDWNGDGRDDVLAKSRDGRWFTALSDARDFGNAALWLSGFADDGQDGSSPFMVFSGDWNGDGKTDIGAKARDGRWYIAFSSGTGFVSPRLALSGFVNENIDSGGGGFTILIGDWDGDGRSDIGVKSNDGRWFSASSNGSSFVNARESLSGFGSNDSDPGGAPFLPVVGDWDGDGKDDVAVKSRDGRWYTAVSNGTSFIHMRLAMTGFGNDALDGGAPFTPFAGDWNGDGLSDVGVKSEDGRWFLAYGDGNGFGYPRLWH